MMGEPVPLETAWRWIDENATRLDAESVALEAAHGRIRLDPPRAASDVPTTSCAVEDGYAVSAEVTVGAAPYNPLSCPIAEVSDSALPRGMVTRVSAGQPLPAGANAVVPCDAVEPESYGRISVLAAVAEGVGVMMAASELRAGEPLWPAGRRRPLRAAEIGLLSAAGIARLAVVRRPRTRILIAGAASAPEALGPMLRALVERDGGAVTDVAASRTQAAEVADLVAGADFVVIAHGGERHAGQGFDAIVGGNAETAIRGVAIEPGRETCLARLGDAIIALLPAPAGRLLLVLRARRGSGAALPGRPRSRLPVPVPALAHDPQDRIAARRDGGRAGAPRSGRARARSSRARMTCRRVCATPQRPTASCSCRPRARALRQARSFWSGCSGHAPTVLPTMVEARRKVSRARPKAAADRLATAIRRAAQQEQFLEVVDRDEAIARFHRHLELAPLGKESVTLGQAVGRVLAEDVVATVDVPGFDRSNVDGFALRAADTAGASASRAARPRAQCRGADSRGGVPPAGAARHRDRDRDRRHDSARRRCGADGRAYRLRRGDRAHSRGAAGGAGAADRVRRERSGARRDRAPAGQAADLARDRHARGGRSRPRSRSGAGLASPCSPPATRSSRRARRCGRARCTTATPPRSRPRSGAGRRAGPARDRARRRGGAGAGRCGRRSTQTDLVILSGGTSKGAGDVSYRAVARLGEPGILVHGVALKPGKPLCLAVVGTKPVVVLPGFPTSAMFTFEEFAAPLIRAYGGRTRGTRRDRRGDACGPRALRTRADRVRHGLPGQHAGRSAGGWPPIRRPRAPARSRRSRRPMASSPSRNSPMAAPRARASRSVVSAQARGPRISWSSAATARVSTICWVGSRPRAWWSRRSTSAAWAGSPPPGAASATSPGSTCSILRAASTTCPS